MHWLLNQGSKGHVWENNTMYMICVHQRDMVCTRETCTLTCSVPERHACWHGLYQRDTEMVCIRDWEARGKLWPIFCRISKKIGAMFLNRTSLSAKMCWSWAVAKSPPLSLYFSLTLSVCIESVCTCFWNVVRHSGRKNMTPHPPPYRPI